MKNKQSKILSYLYIFSILTVFSTVGWMYFSQKQIISASEFNSSSLDTFVNDFYPWAMTISIGLAVIMLMYSGYLYVTSAGNTDNMNKAKEYIVGALTGLAFLMLAALIFRTLSV